MEQVMQYFIFAGAVFQMVSNLIELYQTIRKARLAKRRRRILFLLFSFEPVYLQQI